MDAGSAPNTGASFREGPLQGTVHVMSSLGSPVFFLALIVSA